MTSTLCGRVRNGLLVLSIASIAVSLAPAHAQDASQPLEFEVRPSRVETETPEARLDRRLKEREFLFRSICNQCGRGDRFQSSAPFNPLETLHKPMPE